MLSIRALVDGLSVFERNKVLGLAFYIQLSSLRRAARILSEVRSVSKTAVWKWVKKFGEKVSVKPSRMPGRLIALDENAVKVNGLEYWVYAAVGVDGNQVLSMKVYPSRNMLATKLSIRDVLKYCDGKPSFAVDGTPWMLEALKSFGLQYGVGSFRR